MKIVIVPCVCLMLAGCGSGGPLGIGSSDTTPIDYSPRAPLVMPPPDQREALPQPQYGSVPQAQSESIAVPDATPTPPPAGYASAAPQEPGNEKSWFQRMFE